jgi:hypothetical protein
MEARTPALSPLARKLKLKAGFRAAVVGGPPDYLARLDPPPGTVIGTELSGPLDWIQVFVASSAELAAIAPETIAALEPAGILWISFPKGASKLQTDLTRDKGWEPLAAADLKWLTLVSVDDAWSAFAVRRYRSGEPRQSFR